MVLKEQYLPYDRTVLSKNVMGALVSNLQFRDADFLKKYDINVISNSEVHSINYEKKFVETINNNQVPYDGLLIASGGRVRIPDVEGIRLDNVFTLREYNDLEKLRDKAKESSKLVVIGASFIGLEAAASLKDTLKDKLDVVVCDAS